MPDIEAQIAAVEKMADECEAEAPEGHRCALRAAAETLRGIQWRPIETAPKSEAAIFGESPSGFRAMFCWEDHFWRSWRSNPSGASYERDPIYACKMEKADQPTQWLPLASFLPVSGDPHA